VYLTAAKIQHKTVSACEVIRIFWWTLWLK